MNLNWESELPEVEPASKPYCIIGAGKLTAHVWKQRRDSDTYRYRFNLFRTKRDGKVTNLFRPDDVLSLAKLIRVISQVLVDDGCIPRRYRRQLQFLAIAMDELLECEEPTIRDSELPCVPTKERSRDGEPPSS